MSAPHRGTEGRRRFLGRLVVALNAVTGLLVAVPALGYLLRPLRQQRASRWIRLGPAAGLGGDEPRRVDFAAPDDAGFTEGTVRRTAFVRRTDAGFVVFSSRCTHMGCTVAYNRDAQTFDCPCHGGRYDLSGAVVDGPPPHPLVRYPVRQSAGNLEIQV